MTLHAEGWVNMAESDLSVLSSQCLDRRIDAFATLREEVVAWVADRNKHQAKADWDFTADDACVKLKSLYPFFTFKNRSIGPLINS